jgi:hypothetical protein
MGTMLKIAVSALPVLGTVGLFLVLYANCLHGRLILVALMLANLAVAVVPLRNPRWEAAAYMARIVAICVISGVGTVLAVEFLFPVLLPADYAQIRDLQDRTTNAVNKQSASVSRVFSNEQYTQPNEKTEGRSEKEEFSGWHEPGKVFDYYGYDPNEGFTYLNKIRWNSEGFFDRDYSFDKPPRTYRIVVIGDSYVEALQVPLVATFHKLLESSLNGRPGPKPGSSLQFQVIALGNSGSGQQKNQDMLKRLAVRFHPDMVMMALCSNDFCDDDPVLHDERDVYLGQVTPLLRGLLKHHYYVLAFGVRRYAEVRRNTISVHPEFLQWAKGTSRQIEEAWARTLSLIEGSRDFCAARGINFRLVYLAAELEVKHALDPDETLSALRNMGAPYRAITWDMDRSIQRVTRFCRDNHIPLISLLDPLVKGQKETGKKVFGDHYSFFGHEIAASALETHLKTNSGFSVHQ